MANVTITAKDIVVGNNVWFPAGNVWVHITQIINCQNPSYLDFDGKISSNCPDKNRVVSLSFRKDENVKIYQLD